MGSLFKLRALSAVERRTLAQSLLLLPINALALRFVSFGRWHAILSSLAPLRAAASAITRFRKSRERTQIQVGVPAPDEYFGTRLRLEGQDDDSIAVELALFIKHARGRPRFDP